MSGVLKNDAALVNYTCGTPERFQHIQMMQGKTGCRSRGNARGRPGRHHQIEGDHTGDTLGDKSAPIYYPTARIPEPSITFAIEPKTRADEDHIGQGIHKILEEDWRCDFPAIRRPRSSCCPAPGSSTSKWWSPSSGSVSRWN